MLVLEGGLEPVAFLGFMRLFTPLEGIRACVEANACDSVNCTIDLVVARGMRVAVEGVLSFGVVMSGWVDGPASASPSYVLTSTWMSSYAECALTRAGVGAGKEVSDKVGSSNESSGVIGEDGLEDGGGATSIDVASPICTSPSWSRWATSETSGRVSFGGTDVNLNFSFFLEGERHGDGGTRVRSISGTGGTECARGVRVAVMKSDLGDGIELVDDGFLGLGGLEAHTCSVPP